MRFSDSVRSMLLVFFCSVLATVSTNSVAKSNHEISIATSNEAKFNFSLSPHIDQPEMRLELITVDGVQRFDLQPNKRLLSTNLVLDPAIKQSVYKGKLQGNENSWARFTYFDGALSGAYFDGESLFFVDQQNNIDAQIGQLRELQGADTPLIVYNANDVQHSGTCALHDEGHETTFSYQDYIQQLSDMASSTAQKELKVSLVADEEFESSNTSELAEVEMLAEMNIVDGIFSEQVGVTIQVDEIRVLTDNGTLTQTDAVDLIIAYRTYVATQYTNPGASHLFTGKDIDGSTIGIAYVGALCNSFAIGVTQRFGVNTALVAAHEFGHNFGAPHDNQSNSVCESTPGTFLMNPGINGSDTFSDCSLTQMAFLVDNAACLVDIEPPLITSTGNVNGTANQVYNYDSDNMLEATGSGDLLFNLDFGPEGMTVSDNGTVNWLPSIAQVGNNAVQISVSSQFGSDTQNFGINVAPAAGFFSFDGINGSIYTSNQDGQGQVGLSGDKLGVILQGNRWIKVDFAYNIQASTVMELDFISLIEGEIHGIGFNTDNNETESQTFNLHGTEAYGIMDFRYTQLGQLQRLTIPIGEYFTGTVTNMFFIMDNDSPNPVSNSGFKDILLYDSSGSVGILNIEEPATQ